MKHILLTNDDSYLCAGFYPLLTELRKRHEVTAIAPKEQKSWVGKSVSAHKNVKVQKIAFEDTNVFAVEGTPADCVQIGIYGILPKRPDLVASGINAGENVGHGRILSSGTVGAAME